MAGEWSRYMLTTLPLTQPISSDTCKLEVVPNMRHLCSFSCVALGTLYINLYYLNHSDPPHDQACCPDVLATKIREATQRTVVQARQSLHG